MIVLYIIVKLTYPLASYSKLCINSIARALGVHMARYEVCATGLEFPGSNVIGTSRVAGGNVWAEQNWGI